MSSRLNDRQYLNWLKVGQGLLHLRDVLAVPTERVMRAFYATLPNGPGCTKGCAAANIKKQGMYPGCRACSPRYKVISQAHNATRKSSSEQIFWKNTNPANWHSDYWEVAKCYLGAGQKDSVGPATTDCSNILILWLNCSAFGPLVCDTQLLEDVRNNRNMLFHSPSMTFSDEELTLHFEAMLALLRDVGLHDPDVNPQGVVKLEQIRDAQFTILPAMERKLWEDLMQNSQINCDELKQLQAFCNQNPDLLDQIKEVSCVILDVQTLKTVTSTLQQEMGNLTEEMVRLQLKLDAEQQADTQEVLQDLRTELSDTYIRTCRDVQPIPWVNQRLPLEEVFMDVTLRRTNKHRFGQNQDDGVSVGLADILQPLEPGTPAPRRVLVVGRPGLGKSTICHRLLSGWAEGVEASSPELGARSSAQADAPSHASIGPQTGTRSTPPTESRSQPIPVTPSPSDSFDGARPRRNRVQARVGSSPIGGFAIVLFLMVRNLIVGDLSDNLQFLLLGESWRTRQEELRTCLREKCQQVLILLDGFDEAALPHKDLLANILGEREMRGCTVIVTSRPGFCSSRVDATFQLQGFDHQTRVRYINRFVEVVKGVADHPCTATLVQRLESPGIIGHLCKTPLFLVLVCVLGSQEGSALPDTRTQLCEQFVSFLHRQAVQRHGFQSDYMSSLQLTLQHIALTLLKCNTTDISLATIEQHSATQPSPPGPSTVKHDQPPTARSDVTLRALCQVGFLIKNYQLQGLDEVASGSFTHQSFVDYFAAKRFITMSKEHREAFIADHVSRKTMFHNVFVYVAGCSGREVLVELFDGWRRAVAALGAPRFDWSDQVSMYDLTQANHALLHDAPLSWLVESTDVCSASLALLTHGRPGAVCLTGLCTESCVRGVMTLLKALSGLQASPATHPLYLALCHCRQLGVGDVLDVLKQVGLTHGAVDCVKLEAGGGPLWAVRDCESLAALPVYTRLKRIDLGVCEWKALDALSVSFTPTHALQRLVVRCYPPSGRGVWHSQHLTEFSRNVRCMSNIQRIELWDRTREVSAEAKRDLTYWGAGRGVRVEVRRD